MIGSLARVAPAALLVALAASVASAEGVRIVTPTGNLNFPDIQPAVDAASEGDVLLVAQGTYGGFTIDGKSLAILAVPGSKVTIGSTVSVLDLRAPQAVLLSGIDVEMPASLGWDPALVLQDDLGFVRAQDCRFLANQSVPGSAYCPPATGPSAVIVSGSPRVAFLECTTEGGRGGEAWLCTGYDGGDGGPGLELHDSIVALYDGSVRGGRGGDGDTSYHNEMCGGDGGDAIHAQSGSNEIFASGTQLRGGFPGAGSHIWCNPQIGLAVRLGQLSVAHVIDCQLAGGLGGPGTCSQLPGSARRLQAASILPSGAPLGLAFLGQEGDPVWVSSSVQLGHLHLARGWGVWLTKYPNSVTSGPMGFVPASGQIDLRVGPPQPHPGAPHLTSVFQGLSSEDRHPVLSGARHLLVLSTTIGPDCNGNGVSDYLDVILGTSPDANHNLIPDECPGG